MRQMEKVASRRETNRRMTLERGFLYNFKNQRTSMNIFIFSQNSNKLKFAESVKNEVRKSNRDDDADTDDEDIRGAIEENLKDL